MPPAKKVNPARSEAAKKAAETRKAKAVESVDAAIQKDKWSTWDKRIRDLFIFTIGLSFAINELVIEPQPRPAALIFVANMIGVPLVLAAAERKRSE